MKVLSVVCARAGSKGLKNKCLARINNRMVVEYAIDYSLSLGSGVKTVVSTDIEELIGHCGKKGITCIRREARICSDESRIDDALADAIDREGKGYDYASLVYGNIPTRYPVLFRDAVNFLQKNRNYDAVLSMQNVEKHHPEWMFEYSEERLPVKVETHYRRQELPQMMIHDGHTLLFDTQKFFKKYKGALSYNNKRRYAIYGDMVKPLVNDNVIIDIDTKRDLQLAGAVLSSMVNEVRA